MGSLSKNDQQKTTMTLTFCAALVVASAICASALDPLMDDGVLNPFLDDAEGTGVGHGDGVDVMSALDDAEELDQADLGALGETHAQKTTKGAQASLPAWRLSSGFSTEGEIEDIKLNFPAKVKHSHNATGAAHGCGALSHA